MASSLFQRSHLSPTDLAILVVGAVFSLIILIQLPMVGLFITIVRFLLLGLGMSLLFGLAEVIRMFRKFQS